MKAMRIEIEEQSQSKVEEYIDRLCEEYKISDVLYGNILMTIVDFMDLIWQVKEDASLQRLFIRGYKEVGQLHLEIGNPDNVDFRHYFNELQLKTKKDMLFLVKALTDRMEFSEHGDIVSFTYNLDIERQLNVKNRRNLLKEYLNTSNKNIRV